MKRSGNHALASWLMPQARWLYFNNVLPMRPILNGALEIPPPARISPWLRRQLKRRARREGSSVPAWFAALQARGRPLLVGLEDHPLEQRVFAPTPALSHLLVVRDPVNMLASRIRKASQIAPNPAYPLAPGPLMDRIVRNWKAHARELLGETSLLENKICVSYERWCEASDYRRAISERLGLRFDDSGFSRVSGIGGGSSFDRTRFDGAAAAMRVFERRELLNDAERHLLESALSDPELTLLACALEDFRARAAA
jgi:hypothetical protein